jgi:uncharacterized protein with PQ loop repeat
MHLSTLGVGAGYLGSALGVAMVVPQIVRTLGDRRLPGVSALSWSLTAIACTTWLFYGIRTAELPQIPGNVLLVSGAVAVVLLVPARVNAALRAAGLAGAATIIGGLAVVAPPAVIGGIGGAIGVVSGLPQLVRSVRRTASVSAVSPLTWALRAASQTSWLTYGLLVHDLVVVFSAIFLLTNALVVVALETMRRPVGALNVGPELPVAEACAA